MEENENVKNQDDALKVVVNLYIVKNLDSSEDHSADEKE